MRGVSVRNVNEAYAEVIGEALRSYHAGYGGLWRLRDSRAGQTLECVGPFFTTYERPTERVLLNAVRDGNPFFHLMEALWILAGRDDVDWIRQFNSRIADYSDDGVTFHGAYGYRLRGARGDQVEIAIRELVEYGETRRIVLQIWDVGRDLAIESRDIPCNTHVYLKARDGMLWMTVCCRSNDAIWGCYGANVVHFSVLQEYIAACADLGVGPYTHVSDSLHIYLDNPAWQRHVDQGGVTRTVLYEDIGIETVPLVLEPADFDHELRVFTSDVWEKYAYTEPFFYKVAVPMRRVWNLRKMDMSPHRVCEELVRIEADDWRIACARWMQRRYGR